MVDSLIFPLYSNRLSSILVDRKHGYKFGVWKVLKDGGTIYRCNNRNKKNSCKCTILHKGIIYLRWINLTLILHLIFIALGISVKQRGHVLRRRSLPYCPKEQNLYERLVIYRDAKKVCLNNKGLSGRDVAQPITDAHFNSDRKMCMVKDNIWSGQ